jgi:hypothetical protein
MDNLRILTLHSHFAVLIDEALDGKPEAGPQLRRASFERCKLSINILDSLPSIAAFQGISLTMLNITVSTQQLLRFPGVSSSSIGFSPEMMHPQLQLSQPVLMQGGAGAMGNPDVFRRIMQAQLGGAKDGSQVCICFNN